MRRKEQEKLSKRHSTIANDPHLPPVAEFQPVRSRWKHCTRSFAVPLSNEGRPQNRFDVSLVGIGDASSGSCGSGVLSRGLHLRAGHPCLQPPLCMQTVTREKNRRLHLAHP